MLDIQGGAFSNSASGNSCIVNSHKAGIYGGTFEAGESGNGTVLKSEGDKATSEYGVVAPDSKTPRKNAFGGRSF